MSTGREEVIAEVRRLAEEVAEVSDRPAILMEVCGTHSHQFARYGLGQMLPEQVELLSGPGCPVCVTPVGEIDAALELARRPEVTVATFGDMVRVPGSESTLAHERARGTDVRVIFSPMEAVDLAEKSEREVVLLGVGFETTAPGVAVAVRQAHRLKLDNFSVLCAHKRLIPALDALMAAPDVALDGLLAPGHVSTIIGWGAYREFVDEHQIPCVVAGFEPDEMMRGVLALVRQLADGRAAVENEYPGPVSEEGNTRALAVMDEVFEPVDAEWRGLGVIPLGGMSLREEYAHLDAVAHFDIEVPEGHEDPRCRCGEVLRGAIRPEECGAFRVVCTPAHPLGPCMVSSEGACAAVYRYGP
ncbi:MAG: hydrogenase formation protein HypD [Armatimonadota bacterium]|nr:hydrogenase formation protein HypD [Armatimonadota bacterium]